MEDKRTAIAIFLCIMVVMIYSELVLQPYYNRQAEQQIRTQQEQAAQQSADLIPPAPLDQRAEVNVTQPKEGANAGAQAALVSGAPSADEINQAQKYVVETPLYRMEFTTLGGRVTSYKLLRFREVLSSADAHELVVSAPGLPLPLGLYTNSISDEKAAYKLVQSSANAVRHENVFLVAPGNELELRFEANLNPQSGFTKTLRFKADSYLTDLEVGVKSATPSESRVWLEWNHFIPWDHKVDSYNINLFTLLGTNNKVHSMPVTSLVSELDENRSNVKEMDSNQWVAFADKYFMANLIPSYTGANSRIGRIKFDPKGSERKGGDLFFSRVAGEQNSGKFQLYIGPKDDRILDNMPHQLQRSIDLGFFSFLGYPLLKLIRLFHELLGNYGLAIILLTLLIKAAFLPLTAASFKSMQAMQDLQPEMKELRERIKDPSQLNQEIAGLFKKRGVNPMGGCLPMLLQIPVFFGLYNALSVSIELRHAPFALWIHDLSAPEYLHVLGIGVPVMVLLMGLSMWLQQRSAPQPSDPVQAKVLKYMPLLFTIMFIVAAVPAGLALYMLVNNIISITQQSCLRGASKISPLMATVLASLAIFSVGFVLTII